MIAVTFLVLSWACWRSRGQPLFFIYFAVQLLCLVGGGAIYFFFENSSPQYRYAYASCVVLISLASLFLTVDSLHWGFRLRKMAIPAMLTGAWTRLLYPECPKPMNFALCLILAEAAILLTCGMTLNAASIYVKTEKTATFWMGTLWIVQSLYFYGYLVNDGWVPSGEWAPALIACAGFIGVALTLRQPRQRPHHAL